jgi:hypothetical protein
MYAGASVSNIFSYPRCITFLLQPACTGLRNKKRALHSPAVRLQERINQRPVFFPIKETNPSIGHTLHHDISASLPICGTSSRTPTAALPPETTHPIHGTAANHHTPQLRYPDLQRTLLTCAASLRNHPTPRHPAPIPCGRGRPGGGNAECDCTLATHRCSITQSCACSDVRAPVAWLHL